MRPLVDYLVSSRHTKKCLIYDTIWNTSVDRYLYSGHRTPYGL